MLKCPICNKEEPYTLVGHIIDDHGMSLAEFAKNHKGVGVVTQEVFRMAQAMGNSMPRVGSKKIPVGVDNGTIFVNIPNSGRVSFAPYENQVEELIPARDDEFVFTENLKYVAIAVQERLNTILSGPTGSGKSQMILQFAALLGKSLVRFNMNGQVTQSDFLGKMEINEKGETYFNYGPLPRAMREGHWLLIEELDFAPPSVIHLLQAVLEKESRTLFIPATNERVEAHPDFRIFATSNTFGKGDSSGLYSGTEVLNEAQLRRFQIKVRVNYLEAKHEAALLAAKNKHIDAATANKIVSFAEKVRLGIKNGEFYTSFGTATMLNWAAQMKYLSAEEAAKVTFLDFWEEDEARAGRELIKALWG